MSRWVFDKGRQYLSDIDGLDLTPSTTLGSNFNAFFSDLRGGIADFAAALESLEKFFDSIRHPADFKAIKFGDLLAALVDVMVAGLTLVDAFVSSLLTLFAAALGELSSYLTQKVSIPLISNVYQKNCGEQMTVAGLFALAFAFPLTLGYKAINGANNPPFTPQQVGEITGSSTPSFAASAATSATPAAADAQSVDPTLIGVVGMLAAGTQIINSFFAGGIDLYGMAQTTLDPKPTPPGWFMPLAIIPEMLEQILTAPTASGTVIGPLQLGTKGYNCIAGMWGCYWAQPLLDLSLCLITNNSQNVSLDDLPNDLDMNTLLRYIDPIGKVTSSSIGVITMVMTVLACAFAAYDDEQNKDQTPPVATEMKGIDMAANIVAAIPGLGQFLGLQSLNQPVLDLTGVPNVFYTVQTFNDTGMGSVAGVLMLASAAGDI